MTVNLSQRDTALRELMDDPSCDRTLLDATYRQFQTVNGLLSGWRKIYRARIRPLLLESAGSPVTLLDIGSGGADVPRALARWAQADGHDLRITAIDPDERAWLFAVNLPDQAGVICERRTSTSLVAEGRTFDIVISNHLLHHLDDLDLAALLRECETLAGRWVIHNDIRRGRLGYGVYAAATWPMRKSSFLHTDGLRSIRRSYHPSELAAVVPAGWSVAAQFPYRLLLTHRAVTEPGQ